MIRPPPPTPTPTCPICDKQLTAQAATDSPVFPFCSLRCKQIDLLRWCDGRYAITDTLTEQDIAEKLAGTDNEADGAA